MPRSHKITSGLPPRKNIFSAEQQFFHRGGHAALEQDRLANFAERAQQVVILHVARADLKNIDVARHHLDLRGVHHFADGKETELSPRRPSSASGLLRPCPETRTEKCAA